MGRTKGEVLRLHQEVRTRWNSSWEMLRSFLTVREALEKILKQEQWKNSAKLVGHP